MTVFFSCNTCIRVYVCVDSQVPSWLSSMSSRSCWQQGQALWWYSWTPTQPGAPGTELRLMLPQYSRRSTAGVSAVVLKQYMYLLSLNTVLNRTPLDCYIWLLPLRPVLLKELLFGVRRTLPLCHQSVHTNVHVHASCTCTCTCMNYMIIHMATSHSTIHHVYRDICKKIHVYMHVHMYLGITTTIMVHHVYISQVVCQTSYAYSLRWKLTNS